MSRPDDFNEIENMLADLPTREPSAMLDHRIDSTLRTSPRPVLPWLAIAAAVLIACGLTIAVVLGPGSSTPGTDPHIAHQPDGSPDALSNEGPTIHAVNAPVDTLNLLWTRDVAEETRYTPAGEPYRAVVREALDHRAWADPETGESGHLCVPREELIVVKQSTF